jgi:hypothetical protein
MSAVDVDVRYAGTVRKHIWISYSAHLATLGPFHRRGQTERVLRDDPTAMMDVLSGMLILSIEWSRHIN